MPSLRRTLSSPSVRASPYPSSLGMLHNRPHGRRRSSGSDVSSRRVLADVDWWRVADGQCEQASEEERDVGEDSPVLADQSDSNTLTTVLDPAIRGEADTELERPSTPIASENSLGQLFEYSPQASAFGQLAALGSRRPFRRTASESSASSVDSTSEVLRTPRESLSFTDMGFADHGSDIPFFRVRQASFAAAASFSVATLPSDKNGLDKGNTDSAFAAPFLYDNDLFA
ncbi:hypothetical protein BC834DRAFT_966095 [Gloeopeniophorella convolvens]|nr:hypothetical protein BC834DRAFT_966095 [Gloeopeniophorella convolvens]